VINEAQNHGPTAVTSRWRLRGSWIKYSHESCGTRNQWWLCWRRSAAIYHNRPLGPASWRRRTPSVICSFNWIRVASFTNVTIGTAVLFGFRGLAASCSHLPTFRPILQPPSSDMNETEGQVTLQLSVSSWRNFSVCQHRSTCPSSWGVLHDAIIFRQ
jgi:hypothetical protein